MWKSNKLVLIWIAVFQALPATANAQDIPPVKSDMVRIESDPGGAELFVGDSLIGRTPKTVHRKHLPRMTAWYPSRNAWNAQFRDLPETAPSHLEGVVALDFMDSVAIRSIPAGAAVYIADSLAGHTPLRIALAASVDSVRISKPGYHTERLPIKEDGGCDITVLLERQAPAGHTAQVRELSSVLKLPQPEIIIASGIGLGAGIAAAVFKRDADSKYTVYQRTGNIGDLDSANRYDLYSGIALAILQLSLAYLVYELFLSS